MTDYSLTSNLPIAHSLKPTVKNDGLRELTKAQRKGSV